MGMAMSTEKIEVITSVQRWRRFSVDQKLRLVEESNLPGMSVSHVARIHGVAPSQLFIWRRRMAEGSREAVGADDDVVSVVEVRDLRKQVDELQRVLGKKTMEVEIHAWNGEIRVAFAMDTCDREMMAWSASTTGVTGEMVRDMMLVAVEIRFGSDRASNRIEWLSDNGSCDTALERSPLLTKSA